MTDKFNVEAKILPEPGEEEVWLPAPDYEDRYEISNFGNLRYKKTKRLRKIVYDSGGYPIVCLKKHGHVRCVYLHRLVCEAFNEPPTPDKYICDHIDRCIENNYYRNLRFTTTSGNSLNHKPKKKKTITIDKTPIVFLDFNGQVQQRFENILEANAVLGLSICQIQHNLCGARRPFKNGYFKTEAEYNASIDK